MREIDLNALNPGIRQTVCLLRAAGFVTSDSGDGVTREFECDLGYPYVHIISGRLSCVIESERLFQFLEDRGVKFVAQDEDGAGTPSIQATYDPFDQTAIISLINLADSDWITNKGVGPLPLPALLPNEVTARDE